MKKFCNFLCIIIALSLFVSCEELTYEMKTYNASVSFILFDTKSYQTLGLTRSLDLSEFELFRFYGSFYKWKDNFFIKNAIIKDAKAKVITGSDTVEFFYALYDSSFYSEQVGKLKIKPLTKYELNIELSDGNKITGQTIVPGNFEIIYPLNGSIIPAETLKVYKESFRNSSGDLITIERIVYKVFFQIGWQRSENSYGYIVVSSHELSELKLTNENYFTLGFNVSDEDNYLLKYRKITIYVFALDKNAWYFLKKNINQSGIEGAYGLFGSSICKTISVFIEY